MTEKSLLAFGLAAVLGWALPAAAETESDWATGPYADTRIVSAVSALPPDGSSIYVGWEVKMPADWKTYWRSPGDAGRPPRLDWRGSINLKDAELLYPLPERFQLFDIETLGYAEHVIFPIRITPEIDDAPVTLELTAEFMSCKDICVPLRASYQLQLDVAQFVVAETKHTDAIRAELARVPLDAKDPRAEIGIKHVAIKGPAGRQNLVVSVTGVNLLSGADLFVEGDPGVHFDEPRRNLIEDGLSATFVVPVGGTSEVPDLRGRSVTLTFADGWGRAIEAKENLGK